MLLKFGVKRAPESCQKLGQSWDQKLLKIGQKNCTGGSSGQLPEIQELEPGATASKLCVFRNKSGTRPEVPLDRTYRLFWPEVPGLGNFLLIDLLSGNWIDFTAWGSSARPGDLAREYGRAGEAVTRGRRPLRGRAKLLCGGRARRSSQGRWALASEAWAWAGGERWAGGCWRAAWPGRAWAEHAQVIERSCRAAGLGDGPWAWRAARMDAAALVACGGVAGASACVARAPVEPIERGAWWRRAWCLSDAGERADRLGASWDVQ
jgi:hypothetical protein